MGTTLQDFITHKPEANRVGSAWGTGIKTLSFPLVLKVRPPEAGIKSKGGGVASFCDLSAMILYGTRQRQPTITNNSLWAFLKNQTLWAVSMNLICLFLNPKISPKHPFKYKIYFE